MQFVIPGLTRNPVSFWIPAGVYPGENRGRNDELNEFAQGWIKTGGLNPPNVKEIVYEQNAYYPAVEKDLYS
jgi:hypothetical protein